MHNFVGDALRNNHPLLFWVLLGFAAVPAVVTAASVWLAIDELIESPLLGAMFATAALVIDLFKALALPLALGLLGMRRWFGALVMLFCAGGMGCFSAWATFDRLMSETYSSRQVSLAVEDQRITDLEAQRRDDAARIEQLDAKSITVGEQAAAMRANGFHRRAQEMEDAAMARIDAQRAEAVARRDAASVELTALRSQPVQAAGTPLEAAALLFLGFALVLEVMPAVILSNLRTVSDTPAAQQDHAEDDKASTAQFKPEAAQDKADSDAMAEQDTEDFVLVTQDKAAPAPVEDDEQIRPLLSLVERCGSGVSMTVRWVANELQMGRDKTNKMMQQAAARGVLNKTAAGYVSA